MRPGKLQIKYRQGEIEMNHINDYNSIHTLSHTTWNCKYHIVFAPKYRRKVFYGEKREEIGKILRELCEWKGVKLLNAEACPDHIHMLVEIPPKMSISCFMGFLKEKSSVIIYQKWGNLKYQYRSRSFWCRGYYVDTTGKNTRKIDKYISNQLKEDRLYDRMSLKVYRSIYRKRDKKRQKKSPLIGDASKCVMVVKSISMNEGALQQSALMQVSLLKITLKKRNV